MRPSIWSRYGKNLGDPRYDQEDDQFAKYSHTPLNLRSHLVFLVKFLLNLITTHKMASLKNIITSLRMIVLCYSYSGYHQNDTLELLP